MKKILLAFDGFRFSDGAFDFARKLHGLQPALLTGVFIPQMHYVNLWNYGSTLDVPVFVPLVEGQEDDRLAENMRRFEDLCKQYNISYRVHQSYFDLALPDSSSSHSSGISDTIRRMWSVVKRS